MNKQELYHIHLSNDTNNKYFINNTFIVDKSFNSIMNQRHQSFSQLIRLKNNDQECLAKFTEYLQCFMQNTNGMQSLTQDDINELRQLLEIGYKLSSNADRFRREAGMEDYRVNNHIDLPSRLHSIYLCDKDGIEYWKDIISQYGQKEIEIYKVLVRGTIFKTNEQLIPNEYLTYEETYNESEKY